MSSVHNHLAHACHVCSTSVDSAILKVYPAKEIGFFDLLSGLKCEEFDEQSTISKM